MTWSARRANRNAAAFHSVKTQHGWQRWSCVDSVFLPSCIVGRLTLRIMFPRAPYVLQGVRRPCILSTVHKHFREPSLNSRGTDYSCEVTRWMALSKAMKPSKRPEFTLKPGQVQAHRYLNSPALGMRMSRAGRGVILLLFKAAIVDN